MESFRVVRGLGAAEESEPAAAGASKTLAGVAAEKACEAAEDWSLSIYLPILVTTTYEDPGPTNTRGTQQMRSAPANPLARG